MIIELVVAFVLILAVSFAIYVFGCFQSPRSRRCGDGKSAYACGERMTFRSLKISVSHYRFLVYFVVLDSSVLLVSFASLALHVANAFLFMLYLCILLVSGFLLLEGGDQ
ncbi:MAG: hypothetical protein ACUVTC_05820 [Candidatus Bathycorpusculaceae bacterium]